MPINSAVNNYLTILVEAEFLAELDNAVWDPQFDRRTIVLFQHLQKTRRILPQYYLVELRTKWTNMLKSCPDNKYTIFMYCEYKLDKIDEVSAILNIDNTTAIEP